MIPRRQFIKTSAAGLAATSTLAVLARANTSNTSTKENTMKTQITRVGSQASMEGPKDWFTGEVRIDPLFKTEPPAHGQGANVTFEPGARTAWHTHPKGQTLVITSGCGWVQEEGGPIQEVRPGDTVWFPAGVKHWHGASPTTGMSHIAIQEEMDGKVVEWMEHVTDEQYQK